MSRPDPQQVPASTSGVDRPWLLIGGLFLLMIVAFAILRSGHATLRGNELTVDRAVFMVVNTITLSGLKLPVSVNEYKPLGQAVIFALMVAGTLASLIVAGRAIARLVDLPHFPLVGKAVAIYCVAVVIGAQILAASGLSVWQAIFQAASAFGNAGFVIGKPLGWMDWQTHLVLLPLAIIGGLGIPVLRDIWSSLVDRKSMHWHTSAVLWMAAGIYLVSLVMIMLAELLDGAQFRDALALASTEALNSRTLGMPMEAFERLARPSQWIVLILMGIGANLGGTGGGLGAITLFIIARDSRRLLVGQTIGRSLGFACIWLGVYLAIVLTTTILLIADQPRAGADRMFFLAISAVSNVGTSHESVLLTRTGLYVLSGAMLLGRLAPIGLMLWAAGPATRKNARG